MKIQPTYGAPRTTGTKICALVAAAMIVSMAVLQLFGYEDFASVLSGILPSNDTRLPVLLAGCIVFTELFALPYLLGMYISKLMRIVSALFGFGITGFWLFTSLTNAHATNSGIFSASLEIAGGIIPAIWSVVMFSLVCKVLFADSRFRHITS